jgi:RimJ/RimL family protein N-acetyltransferase
MASIEELESPSFELAAQWLSKPRINRWLTGEWRGRDVKPQTIVMAVRNRRNLFFLIRHDGQPCGLVCLSDVDYADRSAMIWYILGEEALAAKGIVTEAVKQLTEIAFSRMNLASVYAWTMADNLASQRVLHKAGFREAGRLRLASCSGGVQVDRIYFDLVAMI